MPSDKPAIIESIFMSRWDSSSGALSDPVVTLEDVSLAIASFNLTAPKKMSTRNPANFFKDFIRVNRSANKNWPAAIWTLGFTARQQTGANVCFEFIPILPDQQIPFPPGVVPAPSTLTPRHRIESASLPLASRRLGRSDEPWMIQVLVRLRVIETHLSLFSPLSIEQVDHLQMSVKLARSEIDALFLAVEIRPDGSTRELIITCEAKGRRDDILQDQVIRQVEAAFELGGLQPACVLPVVVKALAPSEIYVVEFEAVERSAVPGIADLRVSSEAVYEFVPPIPGVGAAGSTRRRKP